LNIVRLRRPMSDDEVVTVETVSPATTRAAAREHGFTIDKPEASGGTDQAPMASEYLLGALGSCQITTAHKVAAKRGRRIDALRVVATGSFENGLFSKIHLDIHVTGDGEPSDWETVFRLVERVCTVSRALSVPVTRAVHAA
jgi:uncharacterized OsmC-like protein